MVPVSVCSFKTSSETHVEDSLFHCRPSTYCALNIFGPTTIIVLSLSVSVHCHLNTVTFHPLCSDSKGLYSGGHSLPMDTRGRPVLNIWVKLVKSLGGEENWLLY